MLLCNNNDKIKHNFESIELVLRKEDTFNTFDADISKLLLKSMPNASVKSTYGN